MMQKMDFGLNTSNDPLQNSFQLNNKMQLRGTSFSKAFTKKKKVSDYVTIKNLNLEIKQGEFVCILGDVGCGKSSIIQLMIGDLLYMKQDFFKLFKNIEMNDYL